MAFHEAATETSAFAERLRAALQARGRKLSPTQLERDFNLRWRGEPVSVHAVRKWLQGQSVPTQDKLIVLARWLGVTEDWLRWGVGVPAWSAQEEGKHKPIRLTTTKDNDTLMSDESSLLQDYRLLPEPDRLAIRAVVDALLSERRRQQAATR